MKSKVLNLLFAGLLVAALGIGAAAANDGGEAEAEGIGKSYITAVTPTGSTASTGNASASGESGSEGETADNDIVGDTDNTGTNLTGDASDTDGDATYYIEDTDAEGEYEDEDGTDSGDGTSDSTDDAVSDTDTDEDYNYALADPYGNLGYSVATTSVSDEDEAPQPADEGDDYGIATASLTTYDVKYNSSYRDAETASDEDGTYTVYFVNSVLTKSANLWAETGLADFYILAWDSSNWESPGPLEMKHENGTLYSYTFVNKYEHFVIINADYTIGDATIDANSKNYFLNNDSSYSSGFKLMKIDADDDAYSNGKRISQGFRTAGDDTATGTENWSNTYINWSNYSNGESPLILIVSGLQDDNKYAPMWTETTTYIPPTNTVENSTIFNVSVDLVDYLNDSRYGNGNGTYSSDNQGWYLSANQMPFSSLNSAISSAGTTYPLYFGSLLFENNRNNGWSNWHETYNIAVGNSDDSDSSKYSASVQGLVYEYLVNDDIADPSTHLELPYFNKSGGALSNGMDWYEGYEFPMRTEATSNPDVVKYVYDSSTDYAVYLNWGEGDTPSSKQLARSNDYMYDSDGNRGFFPFNKAGETAENTNYGYGVKFTIPFTVNDNGTIEGTADGEAIKFEFTGDDDVWVFIDGALVLDMGGAHSESKGYIDFKEKKAVVEKAVEAGNNTNGEGDNRYRESYSYNFPTLLANLNVSWNSGDTYMSRSTATVSTDVTKWFTNISLSSGGTLDSAFDYSKENASKTIHTLTMFYMERGMFDSNLKISFTITPIEEDLKISKTVDTSDVNDGLQEAVKEADDFDGSIGNTDAFDYAISDSSNGTTIQVYPITEGANAGKYSANNDGTGQLYEEGDVFSKDGYYYVYVNANLDMDSDTYNYTDESDPDNIVVTEDLNLKDNKVKALRDSTTASHFREEDGDYALSAGDYVIITEEDYDGTGQGDSTTVVRSNSLDHNIFSYDTTWKLEENDHDDSLVSYTQTKSGSGYKVTFQYGGEFEGDTTKSYTPETYYLDYTNKMKVGSFTVTKAWNSEDSSYLTQNSDTFTFKVELDLDGDTGLDNYTFEDSYSELTYTISGGAEENTHTLGSDQKITLKVGQTATFTGVPVGALVRVTEVTDSTGLSYGGGGWHWRVQGGEYVQTATITDGSTEDPVTISFTNELDKGDLVISKTVKNADGENPDASTESEMLSKNFTFKVTLYDDYDPDNPDSGIADYVNESHTVVITGPGDDDSSTTTITFSGGVYTGLTLKSGQTATIYGLPTGVTYVVEETADEDYITFVGQLSDDDSDATTIATDTIIADTEEDQAEADYFNKYNALGSITVIKKNADGGLLNGVKFTFTDGSGGTVTNAANVTYNKESYVTGTDGLANDDGTIYFEKLKKGTYVITEIQTLQGYTLLKEPITITIPLTLTDTEVEGGGIDTSKAKHNSTAGEWYFYDLTYEVVNTANLDMPQAGNTTRNFVVVVCVVFLTGGLGYFALCGKGLLAVKAVTSIPAALDLRATRAGAYGARIVRNAGKFKKRE